MLESYEKLYCRLKETGKNYEQKFVFGQSLKCVSKSTEIEKNWAKVANFDICFLENFDQYCQKFASGVET